MRDANSSFKASVVATAIGSVQLGLNKLGFSWSLASASTREVHEFLDMITAGGVCVSVLIAMFWSVRSFIRWARGQQAAPGDSQPPTARA